MGCVRPDYHLSTDLIEIVDIAFADLLYRSTTLLCTAIQQRYCNGETHLASAR